MNERDDQVVKVRTPSSRRRLSSWRTKAAIQRAIARLPVPLGDWVYHGLQGLRGGVNPEVARHVGFIDQVQSLRERLGEPPLAGLGVVELGSGWSPLTPMVLLRRGARSVDTFDLNRHYSRARIRAAAAAVSQCLGPCDALGLAASTGSLPPAIRYHPHTDLGNHAPPDPAHLAVSRFVLEHVRPEDIVRIHRNSLEWMAPGGLWIHWVSPSDHRSYDDKSLGPIDFLRYSQAEWSEIAGNRFAYHNRLRLPHYRGLFAEAGWTVVHEDYDVPADAPGVAAAVPVHPDFAGLSEEELSAGSLWFVLSRAGERGEAAP